MSCFLVTITPATPNGDLHIGHIAGSFIAADIFSRAQCQHGHDCVLVSYSDDYHRCPSVDRWASTLSVHINF
ncbi:class I tRNA ligase family protein [Acerihabitans sp. TG2]|uniref:class I tRNA ligase family protein n=1 Tax=Acerihabitans sp. TG2 TaxID=3096008 RepID=UPI003A599458